MRFDFFDDPWVAVIGFGFQRATKRRVLVIGHEDGEEEVTLVLDEDGAVIGDALSEQTEREHDDENPERDIAATVLFEGLPATLGDGRETHAPLRSKSMRGSTNM